MPAARGCGSRARHPNRLDEQPIGVETVGSAGDQDELVDTMLVGDRALVLVSDVTLAEDPVAQGLVVHRDVDVVTLAQGG